MAKIDVFDVKNSKVGTAELHDAILDYPVNTVLIHEVVKMQLACRRAGTHATKTKGLVSGGGRKPWKQKGTGRARQGSIRAPQWIKGGIALGPKPRSYRYSIPKKVKQLAFKSVLTSKLQEGKLVVLDKLNLDEIKTKAMLKVLDNIKVNNALVMLGEKNLNVQASARNIEGVKTTLVNTMNIFDLLKYDSLVVTKDAVKKLEEVYA